MDSGASLDGRCDVDMILQREIRNGQQKCRVASLAASVLHNISAYSLPVLIARLHGSCAHASGDNVRNNTRSALVRVPPQRPQHLHVLHPHSHFKHGLGDLNTPSMAF